MPELLGLNELQKRAGVAGYTKISRLGDAGSAALLNDGSGVTSEEGSAFADADVSYILNGDTVIVRKVGKGDIYCASYVLS